MERRKYDRALSANKTVTTKLIWQISDWAFIILTIGSSLHFFYTYERAKSSIIQSLHFDIDNRLERSQRFLSYIESTAENLEKEFLQRYDIFMAKPEWTERLDTWYEETSPGVLRLKSDFYHGVEFYEGYFHGITLFVGPRTEPITQEFKLRILAAQHTLNKLGLAWEGVVASTHFSFHGHAYRYGGEELALLLPVSSVESQREAILSMLDDIDALNIPHEFSTREHADLSVSFGVAPLLPGDSPEDVIRRADARLYEAKRNGGNQISFCPQLDY